MSHGPILLATFAIEFDEDAEYRCIADGAPTLDVLGHDEHGHIVDRSELARVASSEPGTAVSAALLATVSTALTAEPILDGSNARLAIHSFKFCPASSLS